MSPLPKATDDQTQEELKRFLIAKSLNEKQIKKIFNETSQEEIEDILRESKELGLSFIDYWNARNEQEALEYAKSNPLPKYEDSESEEEVATADLKRANISKQIEEMDPRQPSLYAEALAKGLNPKTITTNAQELGLSNIETLENAIRAANFKSIQISEAWEKIISEAVDKGYNDTEVLKTIKAQIQSPVKFLKEIQIQGFENAFMKTIGFLHPKNDNSNLLTNNPIEHQSSKAKEESSIFPNLQELPSLFDINGNRISDPKDSKDGGRVEAKRNPLPVTGDSKKSSEEVPQQKKQVQQFLIAYLKIQNHHPQLYHAVKWKEV